MAAASLTASFLQPNDKGSPLIWKPHGTIERGREAGIRITLSQVRGESYDRAKTDSYGVFSTAPLLVIGYSGYDSDISQTLRQAGQQGGRIFWLSRGQPRPGEPSQSILASFDSRGHLLTGNISDLFAAIASEIRIPFTSPPDPGSAAGVLRARAEALVRCSMAFLRSTS